MLWSDERIEDLLNKVDENWYERISLYHCADLLKGMRYEYEQRIAELEARLTTAETGEGWIEWRGGYKPVDDDQTVEIKLRDGETDSDDAGSFAWWHSGEDDDIVAYRVVGGE